MKYNTLDLGQIEAIVNKLGGIPGVKDFLSGKTAVSVVELASVVKPAFEIWKTIDIGTRLQSVDDFCQSITGIGGKVSQWSKDIIGKPDFSVAQELTKLNLVKVSVAELGFHSGATLKEIYKQAISQGLELVLAEAGLQLRLQYQDQPSGECLIMAMEPIKDSGGDLRVFHVRRDDGDLWLNAPYGSPVDVWDPERVFVFAVCQ